MFVAGTGDLYFFAFRRPDEVALFRSVVRTNLLFRRHSPNHYLLIDLHFCLVAAGAGFRDLCVRRKRDKANEGAEYKANGEAIRNVIVGVLEWGKDNVLHDEEFAVVLFESSSA